MLSESKIATLQNAKIAEAEIFEKSQRKNHELYPATSSGNDNIRLLLLVGISARIHIAEWNNNELLKCQQQQPLRYTARKQKSLF